jgi:hypothetical protein
MPQDDSASMSEEKSLDGLSRDDNPGDFVLEPEEFVEDVQDVAEED